ncbi:MAG TPA: response regulator transcription factor [Spirochaetota bacterium]|nr:response regulator transcription factor [Spirochaetota bacterium]HPC39621.1 response regulator transcription factor [Spirochaetota bacterium]HPL16016.1 response regulator transcription factor [Spirochaetota bacterium]HQF07347.1 response regulator transcription factor [Spirochaetota bacterium]HQH99205.1 response regulator transcription factor [Spirochaetota bacterium]
MKRIIIADDHEIVRAGLKQIIADDPELSVEGEAGDGQELLEKLRKNRYDVVLLDMKMPGRSGLEILKQLKMEHPSLPVLVLSMHPEEQYAVRTIRAGASGYITKETAPDRLVEAIRKVCSGGKYISASLAEQLADSVADSRSKPPHEYLTDREFQVMSMIASGKTITEIAKELFLSVKTISTYRQRILEKMNMKNNAELTHYVISNNLIE